MNQAEVSKLMSQLKFAVKPRHRNLKNDEGPEGRLMKLRQSVTALFKYERLEMNYNRADETRGYAERVSYQLLFINGPRITKQTYIYHLVNFGCY